MWREMIVSFLILICATGQGRSETSARLRLAVWDLSPGTGIKPEGARSLSEQLRKEFEATNAYAVMPGEEMKKSLTTEAAGKGCDQIECLSDLGSSLKVDRMVGGSVVPSENGFELSLILVAVSERQAVDRWSSPFGKEDSLSGLVRKGAFALSETGRAEGQQISKPSGTWKRSFKEAQSEAQETHSPILVDIYTDWCGWCKKLDADTLSHPKVKAKMKSFTLLKINGDQDKAFVERYGVSGYPTTLILTSEGGVITGEAGYKGPEEYEKMLDAALAKVK